MAVESFVWEGHTLYQFNETLSYRMRAICQLHLREAGDYAIYFYNPLDGQRLFEPYPSLEEAKAAAMAIYKLTK